MREVDEQVEEELGRFLLSLVQGEDGLVQGEDGPGDVVVVVDVVSTSRDLIETRLVPFTGCYII